MEEMREYPNFGGTERSRREGPSHRPCITIQLTLAALFTVLLITAVAFAVQAFQPHPQPCAQCPFDWIGFRGKCYRFSEDESNWTSSHNNCSALGASLAVLDSAEDLSFAMRHKGSSPHWVGLTREGQEHPWQWLNRSPSSHPFQVQGDGPCAYLGDAGLSSSHCSQRRNWVCTKPALQNTSRKNLCIST
ncbi:C-type lectin domain family 2 member B-like [Excalfactoria chinensis]|uniref:C-type lectin domain family 2 member B-like n=1 Tax=Excalfactoria chinensis TaxID=46218 RepID=UPI003B3B1235